MQRTQVSLKPHLIHLNHAPTHSRTTFTSRDATRFQALWRATPHRSETLGLFSFLFFSLSRSPSPPSSSHCTQVTAPKSPHCTKVTALHQSHRAIGKTPPVIYQRHRSLWTQSQYLPSSGIRVASVLWIRGFRVFAPGGGCGGGLDWGRDWPWGSFVLR